MSIPDVTWKLFAIPPVWHLVECEKGKPLRRRSTPICGTMDDFVSWQPDGKGKCRHCIGMEGII